MTHGYSIFLAGVLLCTASEAATVNTTLTVTATGTIGTTITATGTANLIGIGSNLPFSGTLNVTPDSSGNLSAPFTITFPNGDKLNGTLSIPATLLTGRVRHRQGDHHRRHRRLCGSHREFSEPDRQR